MGNQCAQQCLQEVINGLCQVLAEIACFVFKLFVAAVCVLFVISWLLLFYSRGVAYEVLFPIVVVLIVIPALVGSFAFLAAAVGLIASRPNTSTTTWVDGVFVCTIWSCLLQIMAYWTWKKCSLTAVLTTPGPVEPICCITCVVAILWLFAAVCAAGGTPALVRISSGNVFPINNDMTSWSGVVGEVQGQDLEGIRKLVDDQCAAYADKYGFSVRLDKAFKVSNGDLELAFDEFRDQLQTKGKESNRKQLFHGTSKANARSIVESGFRLPTRSGMFGKGVYFSNTPLKSMQYTLAKKIGSTGVMLLCDVELGNPKVQRSGNPKIEPETDFKRNWFDRAFGKKSYDSVEAADGAGGAVRVPEYVVYKPHQAVPRYILVLTQTEKQRPGKLKK